MPPSRRAWTDAQMQLVISALLRAGVVTASTIVLAGGIYYLIRHGADLPNYQVFHGEPTRLRSHSMSAISSSLGFSFLSSRRWHA
jgi:uncharacterized membrane protein